MTNSRPDSTEALILVLGTAEWNQPIATNQHYMTRELSQDYRVVFVESMGLRRPELRARDLRRIWGRLRKAVARTGSKSTSTGGAGDRPIPENVTVVSPLVFPQHTGPLRLVNHLLLRRQLRHWMRWEGPRLLWAYTPTTYDFENGVSGSVYHCVDLLGEVPGISGDLVQREESRLASKRTTSIGSSPTVVAHLVDVGFQDPLLWPNVADVRAIEDARPAPHTQVARRVVFAGNLSASKVDFELLERVIEEGFDLQLAGPISEGGGDATAAVERLVGRGAVYHGHLSLAELGGLYWSSSAGLIPYVLNSYTLGVNPLKTYEYLAAGIPVISTRIPAVSSVPGDVFVADTHDQFVDALRLSTTNSGDIERRLSIAHAHSWDGRGEAARSLVAKMLHD